MENETTNLPDLLNLPLEDWKPLFIEKAQEGWHYVVPGPMCNCFSTCWTCEATGDKSHKADWGKGLGWQNIKETD